MSYHCSVTKVIRRKKPNRDWTQSPRILTPSTSLHQPHRRRLHRSFIESQRVSRLKRGREGLKHGMSRMHYSRAQFAVDFYAHGSSYFCNRQAIVRDQKSSVRVIDASGGGTQRTRTRRTLLRRTERRVVRIKERTTIMKGLPATTKKSSTI